MCGWSPTDWGLTGTLSLMEPAFVILQEEHEIHRQLGWHTSAQVCVFSQLGFIGNAHESTDVLYVLYASHWCCCCIDDTGQHIVSSVQ